VRSREPSSATSSSASGNAARSGSVRVVGGAVAPPALEIRGDDLVAAGVPEGPAIGRGLEAALRRKLDGEIAGRDEELEAALEATRMEAA
jgi:hypothetical protein